MDKKRASRTAPPMATKGNTIKHKPSKELVMDQACAKLEELLSEIDRLSDLPQRHQPAPVVVEGHAMLGAVANNNATATAEEVVAMNAKLETLLKSLA